MTVPPDPQTLEGAADDDPELLASLRRGLAQYADGDVVERDDLDELDDLD